MADIPTIRYLNLERIQAWLLAMSGSAGLTPTAVELGPLSASDNRKLFTIGIVPGRETKVTRFPHDHCTLPLAIEFRMTANKGDSIPEEAEFRLGEIQARLAALAEPLRTDLLAQDLREVGNELDIDGYSDKTIQGVIFMELLYRHATIDPRVAV